MKKGKNENSIVAKKTNPGERVRTKATAETKQQTTSATKLHPIHSRVVGVRIKRPTTKLANNRHEPRNRDGPPPVDAAHD